MNSLKNFENFQKNKKESTMGCCTNFDYNDYYFTLKITGMKNTVSVFKFLKIVSGKGYFHLFEKKVLDLEKDLNRIKEENEINIDSGQERYWYNYENEMKELSKKFPEALFKLHGEGEENGDIWDKYFKNGKMQVCKAAMTIPPYDESKLI